MAGVVVPETIGIVEDDGAIRTLLARAFERRGYQVAAYGSVRAALDGVLEGRPDLMVVDVRLPDGSGLELIGRAPSPHGTPAPTVLVSGLSSEDDVVRGLEAGAVDYVSKPFAPDHLVARVRAHLARAKNEATRRVLAGRLPLQDGLAFGRFEVLYELGRGGYGAVYLARDRERAGKRVALKVPAPPPEDDPASGRLRFLRECYALSRVRDEHVVSVIESGAVEGACYCSLEYVEGESLTTRLKREGAIDEAGARSLARGLLRAFLALERAEVIHRDVKPDNVLLRGNALERPVLIDFGLARWQHDLGITGSGVLVGTPAFLAPEIILGRRADASTDLYALGATLRYALTCEESFPGRAGHDLLRAIVTEPVPPLTVKLSPRFATLVSSLCAREKTDRPPSAAAALAFLEVACSEPPAPREPRTSTSSGDALVVLTGPTPRAIPSPDPDTVRA